MSGPPNNKPGWNQRPGKQLNKADLNAGKGSVSFDPQKFQNLIRQQGCRVKIYRTTLCPNVKSIDGGEHNLDCDICDGHGFIDAYPITTWSIIQHQDLDKVHKAEGYFDGNTVSGTFDLGIELQYFTLVELLDYSDIFFQLVKKQKGSVDVLKYKALRINMLVDSTGKFYLCDSDYVLDENGSVRWNPGRGPDPDTIYSIHYECAQRFRAIRAMHVNRFVQNSRKSETVTMTKMPEQWMLQREYFIDRMDRKGNKLDTNLIRKSDED